MAGIFRTVATGTVTQANMRISAVNGGATASGGAFVDFTAANVLTTKIGHLLRIKDSAGKVIQGFIKAAGTGETYLDIIGGTNPALLNGDLSAGDVTWLKNTGWTIAGGVGVATNVQYTIMYQPFVSMPGKLIKSTYDLVSRSAGNFRAMIYGGANVVYSNRTVPATYTEYRTGHAQASGLAIEANGTASGTVGNITYQQVLTPSTTGVTITSTKGGATYNWATKQAGFNYNDAAGYTYEIIKVNNAIELDSDAVANEDATIVMTDGSASWAAAGIDDSAYQDGRHIVIIADAAGVVAFGFYKSGGAGAVVSAKGGATQNWTNIGVGFSTAGNFVRKVLFVGD